MQAGLTEGVRMNPGGGKTGSGLDHPTLDAGVKRLKYSSKIRVLIRQTVR